LALYEKNKANTTKARIQQSTETYYKTYNKRKKTKAIVLKFKEINLKFEKVQDKKVSKSSRCTFNHSYYQKTLSYKGLGLCNLKHNRNQNLHVIAETKAENIQIQYIIQCYVRNYLHF